MDSFHREQNINSSIVLLSQLQEVLSVYQTINSSQQLTIVELQKEKDFLEEEVLQLRKELISEAEEKDTQVSKMRNEIRDLKEKIRKSYVPAEEHQKLLRQLQGAADSNTRIQVQQEDMKEELLLLKQENELLREKLEKRKEAYNKSVEKIKQDIQKNQSELEEFHQRYEELQNRYSKSQQEAEDKDLYIAQKENEMKELRTRIRASKELQKKEIEELKVQHQQELYITKNMLSDTMKKTKRSTRL